MLSRAPRKPLKGYCFLMQQNKKKNKQSLQGGLTKDKLAWPEGADASTVAEALPSLVKPSQGCQGYGSH